MALEGPRWDSPVEAHWVQFVNHNHDLDWIELVSHCSKIGRDCCGRSKTLQNSLGECSSQRVNGSTGQVMSFVVLVVLVLVLAVLVVVLLVVGVDGSTG